MRGRAAFLLLGLFATTLALLPDAADAALPNNGSLPSCSTPCISVGDVTIVEGDTGTRTMVFPITLSRPATTRVTVQVRRIDGEAAGARKRAAGVDYGNDGGRVSTITFKVGANGKTPVVKPLNIPVWGDTAAESPETLRVLLSSPTGGARLARPLGVGTIIDDDGGDAPVRVAVSDTSIVEGDQLTTRKLQFLVALSKAASQPVTLQYAVSATDARWGKRLAAGADFGGVTAGSISIRTGTLAKKVLVPVWPDATVESGEQITLTVSATSLPAGVVISRATGTGTIIDDDAPPTTAAVPNSMAAIGDSITRGYNACPVAGDCLAASWSTGTDPLVGSHYTRLLARNPAIEGRAYNYAVNGVTVSNLNNQANKAVTQGVEYVTIEIGTNDVCKPTEGAMTAVATFRNQFQTAMNTLTTGLPNTRVFVASIPDPLRLWEAGKDDATALAYWAYLSVCPSMLANAASTAPADVDRRLRVHQRAADYNDALATVCAQFANCRFDDNVAFDTDFVLGDLGDYFHPNLTGHALFASRSYASGWNW